MTKNSPRQYEQHRAEAGLPPLNPEWDSHIPFTLIYDQDHYHAYDLRAAEQANAHRIADDEPPKGFREPWGTPQPEPVPMSQGEMLAATRCKLTVALADLDTARVNFGVLQARISRLAADHEIALDTIQAFRNLLDAHK